MFGSIANAYGSHPGYSTEYQGNYQPATTMELQPYTRRDSISSDSSDESESNVGQHVGIPINGDVPIPGLLAELQVQGMDGPRRHVDYLCNLYRSRGYDPSKDIAQWADLIGTRAEWLSDNQFTPNELNAIGRYFVSEDARTDYLRGVIGGTSFAAAGGIVGGAFAGPWAAKYGASAARALSGTVIAAGEAVGSKILDTGKMDWRYSTVPDAKKMLHPAAAAQYPDLQPTTWETVWSAAKGFGGGYTLSNIAKIPAFAALTALDWEPAKVVVDACCGAGIGGGVNGVVMGNPTRENALAVAVARDDYQTLLLDARERMNESAFDSFNTHIERGAEHAGELAVSGLGAMIPPAVAGRVLGEKYGPAPNASFYKTYFPKFVTETLKPSTPSAAALLVPYAVGVGAAGDFAAGLAPEGNKVAAAALDQFGRTLVAAPFFAGGAVPLVYPLLVQDEWFDCRKHPEPAAPSGPAPAGSAGGSTGSASSDGTPLLSRAPAAGAGSLYQPASFPVPVAGHGQQLSAASYAGQSFDHTGFPGGDASGGHTPVQGATSWQYEVQPDVFYQHDQADVFYDAPSSFEQPYQWAPMQQPALGSMPAHQSSAAGPTAPALNPLLLQSSMDPSSVAIHIPQSFEMQPMPTQPNAASARPPHEVLSMA